MFRYLCHIREFKHFIKEIPHLRWCQSDLILHDSRSDKRKLSASYLIEELLGWDFEFLIEDSANDLSIRIRTNDSHEKNLVCLKLLTKQCGWGHTYTLDINRNIKGT